MTDEDIQRVWDAIVAEGRAMRALGTPLKDCPPYVDEDMRTSWKMGWHQENEKHSPRSGLGG